MLLSPVALEVGARELGQAAQAEDELHHVGVCSRSKSITTAALYTHLRRTHNWRSGCPTVTGARARAVRLLMADELDEGRPVGEPPAGRLPPGRVVGREDLGDPRGRVQGHIIVVGERGGARVGFSSAAWLDRSSHLPQRPW